MILAPITSRSRGIIIDFTMGSQNHNRDLVSYGQLHCSSSDECKIKAKFVDSKIYPTSDETFGHSLRPTFSNGIYAPTSGGSSYEFGIISAITAESYNECGVGLGFEVAGETQLKAGKPMLSLMR